MNLVDITAKLQLHYLLQSGFTDNDILTEIERFVAFKYIDPFFFDTNIPIELKTALNPLSADHIRRQVYEFFKRKFANAEIRLHINYSYTVNTWYEDERLTAVLNLNGKDLYDLFFYKTYEFRTALFDKNKYNAFMCSPDGPLVFRLLIHYHIADNYKAVIKIISDFFCEQPKKLSRSAWIQQQIKKHGSATSILHG